MAPRRHEWLKNFPFAVGQVTWRAHPFASMSLPGDISAHRRSPEFFAKTPGINLVPLRQAQLTKVTQLKFGLDTLRAFSLESDS